MEYMNVNFKSNETDRVDPAVIDRIIVSVSIAKLIADFVIRLGNALMATVEPLQLTVNGRDKDSNVTKARCT